MICEVLHDDSPIAGVVIIMMPFERDVKGFFEILSVYTCALICLYL